MIIREDVPLSRLNTWHTGGAARYFYKPTSVDELKHFFATENVCDVHWLGLGSNILVPDSGVDGLVLSSKELNGIYPLSQGRVFVEVGVPCAKFAKWSTQQNLVGAEFFAGIPGTIGGALRMNAGAFGGETWSIVDNVQLISKGAKLVRLLANEFDVGYRCVEGPLGHGFVGVQFNLSPGEPRSEQTIKALLKKRNESQPIGTFNCGSVFKNPPNGFAAKLIEECGFKGLKIGGAVVSEKHANFIINQNGASSTDILKLVEQIEVQVHRQSGIILEREFKIFGLGSK